MKYVVCVPDGCADEPVEFCRRLGRVLRGDAWRNQAELLENLGDTAATEASFAEATRLYELKGSVVSAETARAHRMGGLLDVR